MSKRTLIPLAVTLMLAGCAHGTRQMQAASSQVPNLDVPADLLAHDPGALPPLTSGDRSAMLANHVESARAYHRLAIDFRAVVCAVTGQQGYTINGAAPVRPSWCDAHAVRAAEAVRWGH